MYLGSMMDVVLARVLSAGVDSRCLALIAADSIDSLLLDCIEWSASERDACSVRARV